MIFGVGMDIVAMARLRRLLAAYPQRLPQKLLQETERRDMRRAAKPCEFIAGRIAAKEALAKALGTGMRLPMSWQNAAVSSGGGKPVFVFADALRRYLAERNIACHLSISHDDGYAAAMVVAEVIHS
ncbi:MAG: holo-ACP synthase [Gammaproteobacteria bacterium]